MSKSKLLENVQHLSRYMVEYTLCTKHLIAFTSLVELVTGEIKIIKLLRLGTTQQAAATALCEDLIKCDDMLGEHVIVCELCTDQAPGRELAQDRGLN